ncbi:hypothetical protein [Streptomyces cinereoruber]
MSELTGPDDSDTAAESKFELTLGKAHLRMENVSERVQLAVVYGVTACALGLIARSALTGKEDQGDQDDR